MKKLCYLLAATLLHLPTAPAAAPVSWRKDGTGIYPDAQPPVKWSATENVIWKTPLPKKSNASPILVGDRVFVCGEPDTLLCVSVKDGAILWSSSTTYLDVVPEAQREQARAQQAKANELPNKVKELEAARDEKSAELSKTPDKPG